MKRILILFILVSTYIYVSLSIVKIEEQNQIIEEQNQTIIENNKEIKRLKDELERTNTEIWEFYHSDIFSSDVPVRGIQ